MKTLIFVGSVFAVTLLVGLMLCTGSNPGKLPVAPPVRIILYRDGKPAWTSNDQTFSSLPSDAYYNSLSGNLYLSVETW